MMRNEGSIDRGARIAVGLILALAMLFAEPFWPKVLLGVAAAILLITGFVGICPLYLFLGIDTCPATRNAVKKGNAP